MPTIIYSFKTRERMDEAIQYLSCRMAGIRMKSIPSTTDAKLSVECYESDVEEIRSLMKQLKESIWFSSLSAKTIKVLLEAAQGEGKMLRLVNGDLVRLTPSNAKSLIKIHDQLSEENQVALRTMMVESKKTHEAAIQFCLDKTKETDNG